MDGSPNLMNLLKATVLSLTFTVAVLFSGPAAASCNGANPPTITAIDPSFGSIAGGTVVTISGTSLGCVSVTFGGVTANSVTASGNTVTATSPVGAVGNVDLTVTNPNIGVHANASATTQFSYITTATAPTNLVTTARGSQVSVAFAAPANTGGSSITDYEYKLDSGNWVSAGTTTSPVVITGLNNGTSYSINLRAMNAAGAGEASAAVVFNTPSPASEFAANERAIGQVILDEAVRSQQSTISANQRMSRDARERFIAQKSTGDEGTGTENVPFDVDAKLDANSTRLSSKGAFFGARVFGNGSQRLLFGDFDVQHDGDTGSSTATITGRMAWEQMTSGQTLVGYFVGGELAHSNIAGAFDGNQNRIGVTAGGYAVHELAKNTYVDGFLTLGIGRNNLDMANTVLALESEYTTRSMTIGTTLSGVVEQPGYEIWPELSFSYGRTWIGTVGFTGRAYGLVDDALSLDAGSVTLANIMFRPEFRVPMDGLPSMESLQLLTFAPRLICEQVKTTVTDENCGAGAEIGFTGRSGDGLGTYSAKIGADRLGNRTSSTLQLNLEQRF